MFPPSLPEGLMPLVPVAGEKVQFLVELSERDGFCRALLAGEEPAASDRRNVLFRKADHGAILGMPWRTFCEAGWEPSIVMPKPGS